jgi:membrane protein implicated in regulation of membrane protease activity
VAELIPVIGHWFWWIVAAILLIGELAMPGIFLLWLGIAAALVGVAGLFVDLGWQTEIGIFAGFALILVMASWRMVRSQRFPKSDQPHLNRRIYSYVGKDFVLEHPIVSGRGKIRIDDTVWDVHGPDLPAGRMVHVTGVDGLKLIVKAHKS